MQLVVASEAEGAERATSLEEELREVRSKAGGRIKQLCAGSKALEDEVSRLQEVDELNSSKIASLK